MQFHAVMLSGITFLLSGSDLIPILMSEQDAASATYLGILLF
jgi:hypothetical protein